MINNIINFFISFLSSCGIIGGFLLIILESIFPILPLAVFIGFNEVAFGNIVGFIVSYVGTLVGASLSFWLFSTLIRKKLPKILKEKKTQQLNHLVDKLDNISFSTLVLIIAIPFSPAFLINIAAGLSKMGYKKFLLACFISKIAIVYFWGYIGTSLLESVKNPIVLIKIGVMLLISFVISKIIVKVTKLEG